MRKCGKQTISSLHLPNIVNTQLPTSVRKMSSKHKQNKKGLNGKNALSFRDFFSYCHDLRSSISSTFDS